MTVIVLMLCNTTTGRRTAIRTVSTISAKHSCLSGVCSSYGACLIKWTVALSKFKTRMVTGSGILIF